VGLPHETLAAWYAAGRAAPRGVLHDFCQELRGAESDHEGEAIAAMMAAADYGKWQAAAWLLERRHGWTKDAQLHRELDDPAPLNADVADTPTGRKEEVLAEVRRLRLGAIEARSWIAATQLLKTEMEMLGQIETERAEEARKAERATDDAGVLAQFAAGLEKLPDVLIVKLAAAIEDRLSRSGQPVH